MKYSLPSLLLLSACLVGNDADLESLTEDDFADEDTTTIAFSPNQNCQTMPNLGDSAGTKVSADGKLAWVHFSEPNVAGANKNDDTNKGDERILNEAARLIWKAPAGSTIRAAIHSLNVDRIGRALACAQHRGVTVHVVLDGDNADRSNTKLLKNTPGLDVVVCKRGTNRGCATNDPSGLMHTKLMTFSKTVAPDGTMQSDVSWFGSANMTFQTGAKTWNNTMTIYGDAQLKAGLDDYFRKMKNLNALTSVFHVDATGAKIYASPSTGGADILINRLDDIKPGNDCEIRVMQGIMSDKRMGLINKLKDLEEAGCTVRVLGNTNNTAPEVIDALENAVKPARRVAIRRAPVHDKLIIVRARFGNLGLANLVFTGSHNFTVSANSKNDELLARIQGRAVYDAYVGHFERLWAAAPLYPGY